MHLNVGHSKRRAAVGTELFFLSRHRIKQQTGDILNLGNSPHRGRPIACPIIDIVEKYIYTVILSGVGRSPSTSIHDKKKVRPS